MQGCSVYIVESYRTSGLMLSRILQINRRMERSRSLLTSQDYQQSGAKRVYLDMCSLYPEYGPLIILLPSIDRRHCKSLERKNHPPPLWVHQIWLMHTGRWWINHTRWGAGLTQVCAVVDWFPNKKVGGGYCIVSTHTKWLTHSLSNHTDKRQEQLIQTNRWHVKPMTNNQRNKRKGTKEWVSPK